MAIQNKITLEIDGRVHQDWTSYDVDSDFLVPADAFYFTLGLSGRSGIIPDFSGQYAILKINDQVVMTGIIDTTRQQFGKGERTLSISGRDLASVLIDCSAPMTNVKGLTVLDAVRKLVTPLGIREIQLKAEHNPVLDKVDIDVGETAWSAIMKCANSAGLHCWFDASGVLIVGGADYAIPPVATLCCMRDGVKNNFSQAELTYDVSQRFSEVVFLGQKHGRETDKNKNDLKWVYKDNDAPVYKPKTVVLGDVENLEALKKQARKQLSDWELSGFTLTITVPDHKTASGELWTVGQRVHVICEEYDLNAIFFLMGRRFILSRQGGTQTELRLKQDGVWTPDAYQAKAEMARKRKGKKGKKVKDPHKGKKGKKAKKARRKKKTKTPRQEIILGA